MRANLSDSVSGNSFLGMTWKTEATKEKMNWTSLIVIYYYHWSFIFKGHSQKSNTTQNGVENNNLRFI